MKALKKISLALAFAIIISSFICVSAFATEDDPAIIEKIEAQELVTEIPISEGYSFMAFTPEDEYYSFMNENYDSYYVDLQENTSVKVNFSEFPEEDAKKLFLVEFLLDGMKEEADNYEVIYQTAEIEKINGVNMYHFIGKHAYKEVLEDEEPYYTEFNAYMAATKETLYFIGIMFDEGQGDPKVVSDAISKTYINGTFLDGDKSTATIDFSSFPTYKEVLKADSIAYLEVYGGDEFYSEEDLAIYEDALVIGSVALIVIGLVPTLAVTIIAIVLMCKYSKRKKQLKALQEKTATPSFSYNPGFNPQPQQGYQPQGFVQPQQGYQPQTYQPQAQPSAEENKTTLINGEEKPTEE